MWENINCGDVINCGRLSSLLWVVLNAIFLEPFRTLLDVGFIPISRASDVMEVDPAASLQSGFPADCKKTEQLNISLEQTNVLIC